MERTAAGAGEDDEGAVCRMSCKGKAAIITGAARGIGREIALELAAEGARLVINAAHEESLRQTACEIQKLPAECLCVAGDIAREETASNLVRTCEEAYGSVDILVNNAGCNLRMPFLKLTTEAWQHMLDVNLNGVFYMCKAALPVMAKARHGVVINISSTAAKTPHTTAAACYAASKGAVEALTRQLAYEMAPRGIRVNAVCPGPIETDMSLQWTEEYRRMLTDRIPLGRVGRPEDVARMVAFLASDDAGFITGESININGGTYMN